MDDESLVRICRDSFSEEEIVLSKRLLFESVPNSKHINRRNKGKNARDIEDIIGMLKRTDPEMVPTFVARDLQKLPPVTFDHVDVSKLLKDIVLLQAQLKAVQKEYVTSEQLLELRCEMESLKRASIVNNHYDFVNTQRGSAFRNMDTNTYDSGPMALQHPLESIPSPNIIQNSADIFSPIREGTQLPRPQRGPQLNNSPHPTPTLAHRPRDCTSAAVSLSPAEQFNVNNSPTTCASRVGATVDDRSVSENRVFTRKTMAETLLASDQRKQEVGATTWKKVTYKKRKNKVPFGTIGKANVGPEGKFKAAETKLPFFISNVSRDTKECDIIAYIKEHTMEEVTLFKIKRQIEKRYNSYKIYVPKRKLDLFLKDDFWPDGITFRRFVHDWYKAKAVSKQTI